MPGIADLLYLGQPDPAQQIAQALSGQQPGGPAQGPGPNGGPLPNGPGSTTPQDPNNPVAPGSTVPNSPPQPQGYQSSPDMAASYAQLASPQGNNLMSLYLKLDARNRAEDQINHGLALIAANYAGNPGSARAIMQSVEGGRGDAGGTVGNLMSLYQTQQGMAAQQQLLAQAPQIAQKLNMDEGIVRGEIMAGRGGELIRSLEPTEKTRDIASEHDMFIKGGGSEENWQKYYLPMIIAGGTPGITPDMRTRTSALIKWQADPANQGKTPPAWLTDDQKWKLYNDNLDASKGQFPGMSQNLNNVIGKLADASNDPALDKVTGGVIATGMGWLKGLQPGTPEYKLHADLGSLGELTSGMAKRGGPKGVGENLTSLGSDPGSFTNYGVPDFRDNVIAPKMKIALTALANSYGSAGRVNTMPGYLKPYLDPMFQEGGDLDAGVGYKPFTPNTKLKQPNAKTLAAFQNDMEHYGPEHALKGLEDQGFDTSGLR